MLVLSLEGLHVIFAIGDHDTVDEITGNHHFFGRQRSSGSDALHLGNDQTAGVLRRHGDRQHVESQRLTFHGDIALRIGRGTADQGNVNRDGVIKQPFFTKQFFHFHQFFSGDRVDCAAALARINKGAQAHFRKHARLARRDVTIELRDTAQWKVVGFDVLSHGHRAELWNKRPVTANGALHQALMRQPVKSLFFSIARSGSKDEGDIAGSRTLQKTVFQAAQQAVRGTDANKSGHAYHVAIVDQRDRIFKRGDFINHFSFPNGDLFFGF